MFVASFGFMACSDDDDDDPEGAISGWNNEYSVYYDNTNGYVLDTENDTKANAAGVYRAWNRTSLKHLGALTQITLKKGNTDAGKNAGVMGFAWDLQTSTGSETIDDTTAETFNVVGVRNWNGNLQAYVSRYYNVTNKQANNFGAGTNSAATDVSSYPTETYEFDVSKGFVDLGITANGEEVSVWVDVAIVPPEDTSEADRKKCGTYSTRASSDYTNAKPGAWVVAFYDADPKDKDSDETKLTPKKTFAIAAATDSAMGSCYAATANDEKKIQAISLSKSQKKQAVYSNIYKGGVLSGSWTYEDTYFLAEVVEDAE